MPGLADFETLLASFSPKAWWKLDEASGNPQDSSGNGFHMTSAAVTTYQEPGPFAGWDGIEVAAAAGVSRANVGTQMDDITFCAWVRIDSVPASNEALFVNWSGGQGWGLLVQPDLTLQVLVQGVAFETKSSPLAAGVWYFVAVKRVSGTWRYCINGLADVTAGSSAPNTSPTTCALLAFSSDAAVMSQAAYFESALLDSELLALYEAAAGEYASRSQATWRVGTITVPGSTGTVSVTGLGGTPKAVFFFGTNWLTEDTPVTSTGSGIFRGMAAPAYDDPGTIVQSAACVLPAGDANHMSNSHCMDMISTAGVVVDGSSFAYAAVFDSFDADGFTVDFDVVNSSGYKVVYVALMDVDEAAAFAGTIDQSSLPFGFKAGASLIHGRWGGDGGDGTLTAEFYGGAAYPGVSNGGWFGAGLAVHTFPSASGQYYLFLDANDPTIVVATSSFLIASVLGTDNVVAYPVGAGLADLRFQGSPSNGGMVLAWDDPDSQTGLKTPAASNGGTAVVSGLPFRPGLLLGYTISDEPSGSGTTSRGAAGFSIVTPDFQWCATVDGHDQGAFQSFQRGFCDVVHNTDLHAGTVELTADGFVMTTVEDDVSPVDTLWHAFGHPTRRAVWIPRYLRPRDA